MNWFLGFLLTVSVIGNVLMALVIADIRVAEKQKAARPSNDEMDAECLRIVNGGSRRRDYGTRTDPCSSLQKNSTALSGTEMERKGTARPCDA